jgi:hypothetical protein
MLRHGLTVPEVKDSPVLAHLGVVDAALDALLLALKARHHAILRTSDDEPYDLETRRARLVCSLAIALQSAMADYQHDELERVHIAHINRRGV